MKKCGNLYNNRNGNFPGENKYGQNIVENKLFGGKKKIKILTIADDVIPLEVLGRSREALFAFLCMIRDH